MSFTTICSKIYTKQNKTKQPKTTKQRARETISSVIANQQANLHETSNTIVEKREETNKLQEKKRAQDLKWNNLGRKISHCLSVTLIKLRDDVIGQGSDGRRNNALIDRQEQVKQSAFQCEGRIRWRMRRRERWIKRGRHGRGRKKRARINQGRSR